MSLSIGIFFSLMIAGLASTLPRTLTSGLRAQHVPLNVASHVAHLPPVSTMFAALLGYNPIQHLLGNSTLAALPKANAAVLTGKRFFPDLISGPFHHGLVIVFSAAAIMSLLGAIISLMRGKQFYYDGPDDLGLRQTPAAALVPSSTPILHNGPSPATRSHASPAPPRDAGAGHAGHPNGAGAGQPTGAGAGQPNGAGAGEPSGAGAGEPHDGGRQGRNPPAAKGV
jgi:hypothetical protein